MDISVSQTAGNATEYRSVTTPAMNSTVVSLRENISDQCCGMFSLVYMLLLAFREREMGG